jgi:quercetin dioxygenase-like cupin family protein
MRIVSPTPDRTTTTPNATMTALAAPSQGSVELSTWRVRMNAGTTGPLHAIDREQVWMTTQGRLAFAVNGTTHHAGPGEAAVLPAGILRQVSAVDGPAEAIVCMMAGGTASTPEDAGPIPLPWAR